MNSVGYHERKRFCVKSVKISSKPVDCTKPKIAKRSYKLRWKNGNLLQYAFQPADKICTT